MVKKKMKSEYAPHTKCPECGLLFTPEAHDDLIKNLVDEREKMQVELANLRGVAQGLNDVVQGRTRKATSESTATAIERAKDRVFNKRTKKARAALDGK